jgi:colicin import membrane protein
MNRLQKKCLIASASVHGFALLLLVFGAAFFVEKEKPQSFSKLQFVPSKFVESALAGGGGNPNIAPTDDVQKGQTLAPQPTPTPPPVEQAKPKPKPPEPKPEPPKPEPPPVVKKQPPPKPVEPVKPKVAEKVPPPKPRIDLSELKPVNKTDKAKEKAEAEAKAAKEEARRQAAAADAARKRLAQQLSKTADALQRGFSSGTKVDVGGPGGEAYANYGALVQMAYENAWQILPDLNDDDAITVVRVTIARDGRVIASRIIRKSTSSTMDKSVQGALNRVKSQGLPPFPDFIQESERSFTIEFNLKARRLTG